MPPEVPLGLGDTCVLQRLRAVPEEKWLSIESHSTVGSQATFHSLGQQDAQVTMEPAKVL